jgi:sugar phosphate isomerase/epimerase
LNLVRIAVRLDTLSLPFRDAIKAAAEMGAEAVELDARNQIRPSELSDTALRQLRKMLDDLNLRVSSVRFPTRRGYDSPIELDRRVQATKEAMKLTYRLGARHLVNSLGTLPDADDPPRQSMIQVIEDLGRYGSHVGAFLTAETGSESGTTLDEFLAQCRESFIPVAFNPGQLIINRHSVMDAIAALRERTELLYAMDGVIDLAAGRGVTVPLGQGTADFPQILGNLEEFRFRGFCVAGRPGGSRAETTDAISYLKSIHS